MTDKRTRAQRWADVVTEFSGSWRFIWGFAALCGIWIVFNALGVAKWDPYPFLFLNWLLTVISTFQNPLIMLSQNRQNDNDRERMRAILDELDEIRQEVKAIRKKLD